MKRIAVINEVSACQRNKDIINALDGRGLTIYNVGMTDVNDNNPLTYIHTGLMSAILLNTGLCDLVIGGCGTGIGYLNCVMQFPNIICGLILEPLDAWLFSQINAGNCVSLALNKGYGWAADIQLKYIFDKLFDGESGCGYPPARAESQAQSRMVMNRITNLTHRNMVDIIKDMPTEIIKVVKNQTPFMSLLETGKGNSAKQIASILESFK